MNFFSRVEHLRKILGLNMSEICSKISLSRTHLYDLKNGRQIPTAKMFGRLEAAERAAGIFLDGSTAAGNDVRSSDPKEVQATAEEKIAGGEHFRDATEMVGTLRGELAEKNRQIERLLGIIERLSGGVNTDSTD